MGGRILPGANIEQLPRKPGVKAHERPIPFYFFIVTGIFSAILEKKIYSYKDLHAWSSGIR